MHHGVTIWAKLLHVFDRVNILGAAQCMHSELMMYMDTRGHIFSAHENIRLRHDINVLAPRWPTLDASAS
jgi:hypothetical protein